MKKISAFTIMEVIVVMLLSGIVISMSYSVLRLIQHEFIDFQIHDNSMVTINQLNTVLTRDFDQADRVCLDQTATVLKFTSQSKPVITYRFLDSAIIRSNPMNDTFRISLSSLNIHKADSINFFPLRLIDRISFNVETREKNKILLHYRKSYAAQVFLEANN